VLVVTVGVMYGQMSSKLESYTQTVRDVQAQTTRIEHYLVSKDPQYWRKVAQNGDGSR
jgi:hypothetical protein